VFFDERPFVVTKIDAAGFVRITNALGPESLRLSLSELFEQLAKGTAVVPQRRPKKAENLPFLSSPEIPKPERDIGAAERRIREAKRNEHRRKIHYTVLLDRLGTSWKASRFEQTVSAIALALGDPKPPAPTTAYDWVLAFRHCGRNPQSFERHLKLYRPRKSRLDLPRELIEGAIFDLYNGPNTPTLEEIQKLVDSRAIAFRKQTLKQKAKTSPPSVSPSHDHSGAF